MEHRALFVVAVALSVAFANAIPSRQLLGPKCTELRQSDFDKGTYRITQPNSCYKLMQNIVFAPLPENDYWNRPGDPNYPMGQYYLGFFAAITVEADNVEIDLNEKTIKQGKEFYLLQRFWNAIELADRIFVDNEGVASLNFQKGDKLQFAQTKIPGLKAASNVYIHDGTLGLSSHAGIHGNGATGVTIDNVHVKDFEVAGIQCNGCRDVKIQGCKIGPSSTEVPVQATFSNARFFGLFTQRLIPYGFAKEPNGNSLLDLLDNQISFADRTESSSYQAVFDRCEKALELFRDEFMERLNVEALSPEDAALLQEARIVFKNNAGLPDGSVIYGILINHLGVPETDENFYGAGEESSDLVITDTTVVNLKIQPLEIPALQTVDGVFVQGVARDLLRIFDIVDDRFRSLVGAEYKGNFLADVYFAMWALSNDFYVNRVYSSPCGNFGSNSSLPYTFVTGTCTGGIMQDAALTGRDVTMLQKKYFGGLSMSQGVFDWATTPGSSLHKLFISHPDAIIRRQTKHFIQCDKDTMFHTMHGIVGIKVRYTKGVRIKDVTVKNLVNLGDDSHWLCSQKYKLPENSEDFAPFKGGGGSFRGGAAVRGFEIMNSENVRFDTVKVKNLDSDEGMVVGIDIRSDTNDQTDYTPSNEVRFTKTTVTNLRGGHGSKVTPIHADEGKTDFGEIQTDAATPSHNNFKLPKVFIMYEAANAVVNDYDGFGGISNFPKYDNFDSGVVDRWMKRSTFITEEKLLGFRKKVLGFLIKSYGLDFQDPDTTPLRDPVWVKGTDSFVGPLELVHQFHYKGISVCTAELGCTTPSVNSFIHDYPFLLVVGASGLMLYGTFGGEQGQLAKQGDLVFSGTYNFENFTVPGTEDTGNLEVQYFGTCPVQTRPVGDPATTDTAWFYIDCTVESTQLGNGRATGAYVNRRRPDGKWDLWGYPTQVYQDTVPSPVPVGPRTTVYENNPFPSPDVTFNWIADGTFKKPDGEAGLEVFPHLFPHHRIHEAGVRYLKRWTSYNTDTKIRDLRKAFMTTLRDVYGIAASDPEKYYNDEVTNQIDLGGGNTIAPYVVNHAANQRMITKKSQKAMIQFGNIDARLHEGGFRLFVGRAGIQLTKWGYVPYASQIVQGAYVIENDPDFPGEYHQIDFVSNYPQVANEWSTTVNEQQLTSPHHGEGFALNIVPMPLHGPDGLFVNFRGAFIFKNAEGNWPGACLDCPLEGLPGQGEAYEDPDLKVPEWEEACEPVPVDSDITLFGKTQGPPVLSPSFATASTGESLDSTKGATKEESMGAMKEVITAKAEEDQINSRLDAIYGLSVTGIALVAIAISILLVVLRVAWQAQQIHRTEGSNVIAWGKGDLVFDVSASSSTQPSSV